MTTDGGWKHSARACTVCGKPEAFPSHTRFGVRHECRGCGRWAWGQQPFRNATEHREARFADKPRRRKANGA